MESHPQSDQEILFQKDAEKALQNILIVENICSFATEMDLFNIRLVNHFLNRQATRRLKIVQQKPANLHCSVNALDDFLALMKTRIDAEQRTSFPFSAFKLDLRHSFKTFERFATEAGHYVRRLEFVPLREDVDESFYQLGRKIALVLSRTPHIFTLELITRRPVYIPRRDQDVLPENFPQLHVINIQNEYWTSISPIVVENAYSLLSVLISRAGNLKYIGSVSISDAVEDNHGLSALQALDLPRNNCHVPLPIVNIGSMKIAKALSVLQELKKSKRPLRVRSLSIQDYFFGLSSLDLLQGFSDWMMTLSPTLKELILNITVRLPNHRIIYSMPSLSTIEELTFNLDVFEDGDSWTTFHIPLTYNQFPVLQQLNLTLNSGSEKTVVTIEESSLPSVQTLVVNQNLYLLEMNPWHRILPNLRSIHLCICKMEAKDKKNLEYILKHFPRITELHIYLYAPKAKDSEIDCWDILTGSAPRPVSTNALLHSVVGKQEAALEVPIDGVYQLPSLENFPALEELYFGVGHRSNLDAVLYMTRTGRLVPLKFILLVTAEADSKMNVEEMEVYQTLLAQVHTSVFIM